MRVQFVARQNGPEHLVSEAELVFDDGPLEGLKLVGFSLWRSAEGDLYVTFPSRAFGAAADRKYFDYLRSTNGDGETVKNLKAWIVEQYRRQGGPAAPRNATRRPSEGRRPWKA